MNRRILSGRIALLLAVLLAPLVSAAAPKSIALVELDYRDTSGEPQDQSEQHTAYLQLFMKTLAEDLEASGEFVVVPIECDPAPCSVDATDSQTLLSAAKRSGAKLMLYGGVHKVSTLIQFVKVQVIDVEQDKSLMSESMSFRGDDERAWLKLEKFLAKQVVEKVGAKSGDE